MNWRTVLQPLGISFFASSFVVLLLSVFSMTAKAANPCPMSSFGEKYATYGGSFLINGSSGSRGADIEILSPQQQVGCIKSTEGNWGQVRIGTDDPAVIEGMPLTFKVDGVLAKLVDSPAAKFYGDNLGHTMHLLVEIPEWNLSFSTASISTSVEITEGKLISFTVRNDGAYPAYFGYGSQGSWSSSCISQSGEVSNKLMPGEGKVIEMFVNGQNCALGQSAALKFWPLNPAVADVNKIHIIQLYVEPNGVWNLQVQPTSVEITLTEGLTRSFPITLQVNNAGSDTYFVRSFLAGEFPCLEKSDSSGFLQKGFQTTHVVWVDGSCLPVGTSQVILRHEERGAPGIFIPNPRYTDVVVIFHVREKVAVSHWRQSLDIQNSSPAAGGTVTFTVAYTNTGQLIDTVTLTGSLNFEAFEPQISVTQNGEFQPSSGGDFVWKFTVDPGKLSFLRIVVQARHLPSTTAFPDAFSINMPGGDALFGQVVVKGNTNGQVPLLLYLPRVSR